MTLMTRTGSQVVSVHSRQAQYAQPAEEYPVQEAAPTGLAWLSPDGSVPYGGPAAATTAAAWPDPPADDGPGERAALGDQAAAPFADSVAHAAPTGSPSRHLTPHQPEALAGGATAATPSTAV